MGHVYRATQAPINREVAIKVLRVDLAHQEGVAERFTREARAASMIQHPNAITIFDFGRDDEILYLAMEFLSGETLRQRLRREPPLELTEALDMFESMAGALGAAHRVGVVHRDLKPDNIFLAKFDAVGQVVKVLDFGLAKLLDRAADNDGLVTEANMRLGTPRYMAPEQALGIQPIDSRCDVYALGLLLFEMLAQRAPFTGEDGMEVLAQRLRREAPRLSQIAPQKRFTPEMDELLASMLKRDREHRPQDANVVLTRIREIRKNNQVQLPSEDLESTAVPADGGRSGAFARAGAPPPYAAPPPGRNRPATAAGVAAVAAPQARGAEAMVRLDQDDFPEKPTVVVDTGAMDGAPGVPPMAAPMMAPPMAVPMQPGMTGSMMQAPMAASPMTGSMMQLRASNPGGQLDPQMQMQMYGGAPLPHASGPVNPAAASTSTSAAAVGEKRKRTLLLVGLVIVIAILAPLVAWLVRNSKTGGDEHPDPSPTPEVVRPKTTTPPPPPSEDPQPKANTEPSSDPGAGDKGTSKKTPIKKKGGATPAKPKADKPKDTKPKAIF
jgi:hypothetical protein